MAAFRFTFILIMLLTLATPVQAQSTLEFNIPVSGSLNPGETARWSFNGQSGQVISLRVESTGDLDPVVTLSAGERTLISNDDYAYLQSRDALIEAVALIRTDTYTVTVSAFGDTSGDFRLTLLPGYGVLSDQDEFDSELGWQASDDLNARLAAGELELTMEGAQASGYAYRRSAQTPADFYAHMRVVEIANSTGWTVGLALRRRGESAYVLAVNSEGRWRFLLRDGGQEQVLRDWTAHPNIIVGQTSFTLGALARGTGFDFYYNGGFIGSVSDATLSSGGQIGLVVGTLASTPSETSVNIDNFMVTTPLQIEGEALIPQQVMVGDAAMMVAALEQRHVVSAAGQMALTVPDSSVVSARAGVNRLMLGRGTRYTNFAMGATVDIQAGASGPAGCGLVFRSTEETAYTLAFLDQTGGHGVSQRRGEVFSPGLFAENPALGQGQHHLLVIADDEIVYYYVDGQLVGSLEDTPQEGEIGVAVVNYADINNTCRFTNLWLWRWD